MVDIYNNARAYERMKRQAQDWPIHEENKRHIAGYLATWIDRRSPGRRASDLWLLKKLFVGTSRQGVATKPYITRPLSLLTLDDFRAIRAAMDRTITSKDTYHKLAGHIRNLYEDAFLNDDTKERIISALYRKGRRKFFRWANDTPETTSISSSQFYTGEEFQRILRVADQPRDRALLAVAWESTARPNEYLTLTVGDVEELPHGFKIRAHISKRSTGQHRYLYIFAYRADFNQFWRTHPFRHSPRAPLFYDLKDAHGKTLSAAGANRMLKRLDARAGVHKNGTLYFLRHGGYTWKRLQGMNPALAGRDMGWAPGGKEERRYLHLQEDDLIQERLRIAGEKFKKIKTEPDTAKPCPHCHAMNSPVDDRCATCGQELDLAKVFEELHKLRSNQNLLVQRTVRALLDKERNSEGAKNPRLQDAA